MELTGFVQPWSASWEATSVVGRKEMGNDGNSQIITLPTSLATPSHQEQNQFYGPGYGQKAESEEDACRKAGFEVGVPLPLLGALAVVLRQERKPRRIRLIDHTFSVGGVRPDRCGWAGTGRTWSQVTARLSQGDSGRVLQCLQPIMLKP